MTEFLCGESVHAYDRECMGPGCLAFRDLERARDRVLNLAAAGVYKRTAQIAAKLGLTIDRANKATA